MNINRSGAVGLVMLGSIVGAGAAYLVSQGSVDAVPATAAATPALDVAATLSLDAAATVSPATPAVAAQRADVSPTPSRPPSRRSPASGRAPLTRASAPVVADPDPSPAPVNSDVQAAAGVPAPSQLPEAEKNPTIIERGRDFEELTIASDVVLGLQIDSGVSSENAQVEDLVTAHVTRDVRVGERIAVPSGAVAHGEVTLVERGGRLRERARLGIRFTSLVLADGSRVPISTETIFRDGDSASRESAAKIGGGAIGGAIIGGILGGGKGAVLGGTVGAGAGSAAVLAGGRNAASLPAGAPVTVRLTRPATVTIDR